MLCEVLDVCACVVWSLKCLWPNPSSIGIEQKMAQKCYFFLHKCVYLAKSMKKQTSSLALSWQYKLSWAAFHVSSPLVCQCLSAELPSCIKSFGLPVCVSWAAFHVSSPLVCQCLSAELPSMCQVLWSASVCQLNCLPCIKSFGLLVSVSWAAFHVSSPLVCQCLSAELPSLYQVLWSASVCQLSCLPCIKSFGLPVSVSWGTFHVSSPLVCQCLSAAQFIETS